MHNRKINILYVVDTLMQRKGITAVVTNYLRNFNWGELQVDILAYSDSESEILDEYKKLGANIYFMPKLGLFNFIKFYVYINNFFKNHKYQIVHSHLFQLDFIIFPIARKNGTLTCISHSHNTRFSDHKLKAIRNKLMSLNINNNADIWAACSVDAGVALFGKKFEKSKKGIVIKNGINCNIYEFSENLRIRIRKELEISENEIVLGHVGRMSLQKNQSFIIDILVELCKYDKRYKVVFVGDGPLYLSLKSKVHGMQLDKQVIFLGTRNDVHEIYNVFDFFVYPSIYEGLGIAAIEAQANGLECFISNHVPKDVDLTSVNFLDINSSAYEWAKEIYNRIPQRHIEYNNIVKSRGYDIHTTALNLQHFYDNCIWESEM